eukprot:CAMPEP_0119563354 /NCGR_PEP_ID=MMETSP1352-20130426/23169_1 /TAXON_ID=265584 /ORGANISM="Stauroneis constricta, Strain CCMP1120" /LENGTH=48 /DNA_ID= /DNA_START= /DNA_END= /DNA_ORIENTATION=
MYAICQASNAGLPMQKITPLDLDRDIAVAGARSKCSGSNSKTGPVRCG